METSRLKLKFLQSFTPKCWFPCSLGIIYLCLSASIMYVYLLMRGITATSDRFDGIPCYVVAIHFLLCGIVLLLLSRPSFRDQILIHRFAAAVLAIALLLAVMSVVLTLWIAEKQNRLTVCVFKVQIRQCACRADNNTKSEVGWHFYNGVSSCTILDVLFNYMVAVASLYASGGFLCFLSLMSLCYLWRQGASDPLDIPQRVHHSESDFWMRSNNFIRLLTHFRFVWFPPSYDESQWQERQREGIRNHPPPPYEDLTDHAQHHPAHVQQDTTNFITVVTVS